MSAPWRTGDNLLNSPSCSQAVIKILPSIKSQVTFQNLDPARPDDRLFYIDTQPGLRSIAPKGSNPHISSPLMLNGFGKPYAKVATKLVPAPAMPSDPLTVTFDDLASLMAPGSAEVNANRIDLTTDFLSKIKRKGSGRKRPGSPSLNTGRDIRRKSKARSKSQISFENIKSKASNLDKAVNEEESTSTLSSSRLSASTDSPSIPPVPVNDLKSFCLSEQEWNNIEFITDANILASSDSQFGMQKGSCAVNQSAGQASNSLASQANSSLVNRPVIHSESSSGSQSFKQANSSSGSQSSIEANLSKEPMVEKTGQNIGSPSSEPVKSKRQQLLDLWKDFDEDELQHENTDAGEFKENYPQKGKWRFDLDVNIRQPLEPQISMPREIYNQSIKQHKTSLDLNEKEKQTAREPVPVPVPVQTKPKIQLEEEEAIDPTPSAIMTSKKKFYCWKCAYFYETLKLIKEHSCLPLFKCEDCQPIRPFRSKQELIRHLHKYHVYGAEQCSQCKYKTFCKTYLMQHMNKKHPNSGVHDGHPNSGVHDGHPNSGVHAGHPNSGVHDGHPDNV